MRRVTFAVLLSSLPPSGASSWIRSLDDTSVLVQQGNPGARRSPAATVSLIEEEAELHAPSRPVSEQFSQLKGRVSEKMSRMATGINKGVSTVNSRMEHSVGNMMSKANSAVDDIHSAASNALQGVKDFSDAASEPITKKVNSQTAMLNSKVKVFITKINKAIDDMKGGMHDLAHGLTDGMKEASEKIAAQLAQSVHEHVRQEIELARAAEPASLLEVSMEPARPSKPVSEQFSQLKDRVSERMNKVATGLNKGVSTVNSRMEHSVGNMMSKANSAVDDIHSAASNALQGVKDFSDAASEPITKKVNSQTAMLNSKVKVFITKINKAIDDMKGGMHDLAHGLTDGMKEASEKIAAQLAQSVHEHVRQEIELARAAEPASLLEVRAEHNGGAAMSKAHTAVDTIRTAASRALDGMRDLMDTAGGPLKSAHVGPEVEEMISRTNQAIGDMQTSVHDFAHGMTDGLMQAGEKISAELTKTVDEHVRRELELARAAGA
eukprot:CAMPEP_0204606346 /NCGR_PEP_ID=MMETSP0661-20131031/59028_1 /ASSEMBLY_ACC=CAM_ASM_000606 /TAXON_ID=109239 /ORGANISM="Alexandrium margalefi, Strain AMGDE01CS-322" /LENGTH=493 /DNA_ID=CAMNT_0051617665 /DNA_START=62 /DNA_END=1543 /DNA_ORIENTATION=+